MRRGWHWPVAAGKGSELNFGATLKALTAVAIKLLGAALSYVFILVVAQVTDEFAFGVFGAAWSLHILISVAATLGQNAVIVRFWSTWKARGDVRRANGHLLYSLVLTAGGLITVGAATIAVSFNGPAELSSTWLALCFATYILIVANGWAAVVAGALRARGSIVLALAPRDVLWRILSIAAIATPALGGAQLDAADLLLTFALLLAAIAIAQTMPLAWTLRRDLPRALSSDDRRKHKDATLGLWGSPRFRLSLGR